MKLLALPPQSELREAFTYEDGVLLRRGKPTGRKNTSGRLQISYKQKRYISARLIWAYHHGDPGDLEVDHIDGDSGNDRIENLRLATHTQNQWNRPKKGVHWDEHNKVWVAQLSFNGKQHKLGQSKDRAAMVKLHQRTCKEQHGEFSKLCEELSE